MDTFSCPSCGTPVKLALVNSAEPIRQVLDQPDPAPAEASPAAPPPAPPASVEGPEDSSAKGRARTSSRPDVVAYSESVDKFNQEVAGQLRAFIEDGNGWVSAQPSPAIFDRFQAWCAEKHGRPADHITKNRLSKVLVDILGATWHKTGKGRMYLLPAELRPAAPVAGEEEPTVPVPAPASTPRVQAAANVVQLRGRNAAALSPASEELAARTAAATPAAAPFVDLPEFGNGSDVEVRAEGAFDASSGERLPGDGEPSPLEAQLLALAAAPPAAVDAGDEPDPDRLCNSCVLPYGHGGPHGAAWNPSDDLPAAAPLSTVPAAGEGASVVLEEPLRNVRLQPDGSVTAEGTFPAAVAGQVAAGAVTGLSVGPVDFGAMLAAAEEADEEPAVPGPIEASLTTPVSAQPLPAGARPFSIKLSDEQAKFLPAVRLAAMLDQKMAAAGMVRLGTKDDVEVRSTIPGGPYATALAAPAPAVVPAAPAPGYGAASPDPAIREAVAVGEAAVAPEAGPAVHDEARGEAIVPLTAEEAALPFGALEALWIARLPQGLLPTGAPVELITTAEGGPAVSGLVLGGADEAPAEVSGEDLQGLVADEPPVDYEAEEAEYEAALAAPVPDAGAVALAAYRAAAAGLSVPDHVVDDGDWG